MTEEEGGSRFSHHNPVAEFRKKKERRGALHGIDAGRPEAWDIYFLI